MLRHLLFATALIVLSAGAARAQTELWLFVPRDRVPEDAGREREAERRYQETMKKTNTAPKAAYDPWRSIRPAPTADRHQPQ